MWYVRAERRTGFDQTTRTQRTGFSTDSGYLPTWLDIRIRTDYIVFGRLTERKKTVKSIRFRRRCHRASRVNRENGSRPPHVLGTQQVAGIVRRPTTCTIGARGSMSSGGDRGAHWKPYFPDRTPPPLRSIIFIRIYVYLGPWFSTGTTVSDTRKKSIKSINGRVLLQFMIKNKNLTSLWYWPSLICATCSIVYPILRPTCIPACLVIQKLFMDWSK